jgi:hypothetical protein
MDALVVCIAAAFSGLLFLGGAWLTRAGYWRVAAALMSGLVAAAFAFGLDRAAFEFGWWTWGKMETSAPVLAYASTVLWFGGGLGLVGWRMIRNWGGAGEALYFLGFVLLGLGRDYALSATGIGVTWGEGYLPLAISAAGWLVIAFLVQLGMQLLVGPVDSDPLAPERLPALEPAAWPFEADMPRASFVSRD